MPVRCASSGCARTRENSGLIFARCHSCNTWWCSKHGTKGNRCPGCGYKYLEGPGGSGGGCFITTATLLAMGREENCRELEIFRSFRDDWLIEQPEGEGLINEYYSVAPGIVDKINSMDGYEVIYRNLWEDELRPCLQFIERGQFNEALRRYKVIVFALKKTYMQNTPE